MSADNGDAFVAVEEAVAGSAGRYALTHEFLFVGQTEVFRRCAGCDDDSVGNDSVAFCCLAAERTL